MRQKKNLRFYSEVVGYQLKKVTNDQKIAKMNSLTLSYAQPGSMEPIQYGDDLYAK